MTVLRSRRFLLALVATLALAATACSDSVDDATNGAIGSPGDVSTDASGNVQSQPGNDATSTADGMSDVPPPPAESETGIGDDPANGGARTVADEPEPVVESADGLSSDPVDGGAATSDGEMVGPAMPPSAAEICAVVEFGYLGLIDGDSSVEIQNRLRDGAATAAALTDDRYATAGAALLDAVGTESMSSRADALLDVCAGDGFERLA